MAARPPLSALLSQVLVAFTIEFDNELERQLPHRTSRGPAAGELETLARTPTNLPGMQRWGYIVVEPDPADRRPKPPAGDRLVCPTPAGRKAQQIWRPLVGAIEQRWRERFGGAEIDRLRLALAAVVDELGAELPDCLPILGYGLFTETAPAGDPTRGRADGDGDASDLPLPVLLSRVLLCFAIEFEQASTVSLAISANLLRVLGAEPVRVRDLPQAAGVSKEATSTATAFIEKGGLAVLEPDPTLSRGKQVRLTPKGLAAPQAYGQLVGTIEQGWRERFGNVAIGELRSSLEDLVGDGTASGSPLFRGLDPGPDGWRASMRRPDSLPHYPMVLHRGGFPDGS